MKFSKIEFGKRLKELRVSKGFSRLSLCKEIGCITHSALSNYENGLRTPNIDILIKLAEGLDTDINYLILGKQMNGKQMNLYDYSDYRLIKEAKRRGISLISSDLIEDIITSLEGIEYITKKISDLEDLLPYKKSNRK